MPLSDYQADMQLLLDQASRALGGLVRPLQLTWEWQQEFEDRLIRETREGLGAAPPMIWFDDGKPGHDLLVGVERFRLQTPRGEVKLVKVSPPCGYRMPDFWAVLTDDLPVVYRFLRQMTRKANSQEAPILRPADHEQLWNNTIGFLRKDHSLLREYGVPLKRGVLLLGEPGNGKTMACRWLRSQCARARLSWQSVNVDAYDEARRNNQLHDLFQPSQPGVVLFDDFHTSLQRRDSPGGDRDQSTFLSELDGMQSKEGVVYLFTSNMDVQQVDPALRRPGAST